MDYSAQVKQAAQTLINKVHAYMRAKTQSELHRQGKMFGVLLCENEQGEETCLYAFSAMLDGSYEHEGFVPPVWGTNEWMKKTMTEGPVGTSRADSQRLQRLLFAQYRFTNLAGETRNLLDIFANQAPILSPEDWFAKSQTTNNQSPLPPSGAGECCAPKLLQYALTHSLRPLALAEFWIGAPSRTELRQEGVFYPPCSGKCVPILRHLLRGLDVQIVRSDRQQPSVPPETIDILYEDDYLMVVNKPAGLLSVPGKTDEPSVESTLRLSPFHFQYIKPVHRLDQATSGLLVLAKTPEVYTSLQAYFQRRDIYKRYEAVLQPGASSQLKADDCVRSAENSQLQITNHKLQISLPLLPNPYDRPRQMVNYEHGKPAITTYAIRERRSDGTLLVDFYPQTGRTHQLRVHAAHPDGLNAPIVGDRLYGNNDAANQPRLLLHAAEIRFVHPINQEEMHFCIPSGF